MATKRRTPARKATRSRQAKQSPDGSELLALELKEIHSAESQLSKVVPRLAKSVQSDRLRELLEERLAQGEQVIADVESALEELDETPRGRKNVAAEGLINDAREHAQEIAAGPALDSVLIGAIQKTGHYCIAAWGTARSLAEAVGQRQAARALERAVKEGARFDEQLTQLAEREVTPALLAMAQESDGMQAGARR
ncbi:MAG: DUF892 family protein [Steroidobacteraceae bacterium]|jgi:ferritin-like metal-binding protein YciE|nr:DUF892 family protein [Steroidobacteraceae bacterium]